MSAEAEKDTTEPDDVNVGLIATIAIVGALLVVAIAAALTALVRSESAEFGFETGSFANLGTVKRLKLEQQAKLQGPVAWGDKAKGQVVLPIDRAMDLVEKDIQRDPFAATVAPPAAAAPDPAPVPAPTPAPEKVEGKNDDKHGHAPAVPREKLEPSKGAPVTPAALPASPK